MNFSQRRRDPSKHLVGLSSVILFHAFVVYALVTGLAKKVVDVVRAPIETKVIEEIKKPPPPPEIVVPPPPRLEAPPPPFIPPPEVQIATPPPPQPTITAVTPTPPPAPVVITPAPPPPPAPAPPAPAPPPPAPPPPAAPAKTDVTGVCSKTVKPELPGVSVQGKATILVNYTIRAGKITKMDVVRYSFPGVSDRKVQRALVNAIEEAAGQYVCAGDHDAVPQEFVFTIN